MMVLIDTKINDIYRFYKELYKNTNLFLIRKKNKFEDLFRIKSYLLKERIALEPTN